ncbi:hypothetical protein F4778DRAFT_91226 [Xylariomycetidae sp. FL2044]|nr:hypothetical protein F4778DRAFT_91226 [Xylariomycetidae sp. FL2044]
MAFIFPIERPDQRAIIACAIIFSLLPVTAVGLRIVSRRIANRTLDLSDYIIISACVIVVSYQGVVVSSVLTGGLGFHVAEIIERFGISSGSEIFIKHLLAIQNLWAISLSLSKVSILVLYSKVFTVRVFVTIAKVTAVVICMWALATILSCFLICEPFSYNWDLTIEDGHCGDSVTSWVVTGVLNILTDLTVLLLPMPYLYNLNLELYKKLVLMGTFGVGLCTCIISIVRVVTLVGVDFTDVTYTMPEAVLFSALEPCLAITLACVPVLRPLLGGRYSPTGTAQFGATTVKNPKEDRGFNKLNDDSSIKRLRPDPTQYDANVVSKDGSPSLTESGGGEDVPGAADLELGTIKIKKAWAVETADGAEDQTQRR